LINELLTAQQEYRLNKLEKQWLAPHLAVWRFSIWQEKMTTSKKQQCGK